MMRSEFCRNEQHDMCRNPACECECHVRARPPTQLEQVLRSALDNALDELRPADGLPMTMARLQSVGDSFKTQHGGAAGRHRSRARGRRVRPGPVTTLRVDRRVWRTAQALCHGDVRSLQDQQSRKAKTMTTTQPDANTVTGNGDTAAPSTPASRRKPAGKVRTGNPQADRAVRAASNGSKTKATAAKPGRAKAPSRASRAAAQTASATKSQAKPARGKAAAAKPAKAKAAKSNGTKNDLALRVVEAAGKLSGLSDDDRACVAQWLHHLPTGGSGADRRWPASLPRPNRSDWR